WADPMIDEVSCGLDAADSQTARVAKPVQVLQSTQPMEDVASPTVSTGQLSAPPLEVPSIPSLDEFLMSITRPLPDPVLGRRWHQSMQWNLWRKAMSLGQ
ncbi:hypothetical protein ACJX0J_016962, partial [Zea mays]